MIEFKNPFIRVKCLECREDNFIEIKYVGIDKKQRSIDFEYEYIHRGELKMFSLWRRNENINNNI